MKEKYTHQFLVVALTTIMGQIYLRPFDTDFRVSIGVIVFTFLLIYFDDVPIIQTSIYTGIIIFSFRGLVSLKYGLNLVEVLLLHGPSIAFYVVYGCLFYLFKARFKLNQPFILFVILSFSDFLSNITEIILRGELFYMNLGIVLNKIVLVALFRGLVSLLLFWLFTFLKAYALKEEKMREQEDLFVLSSKIISEKFYLFKSAEDIENAMAVSYDLYMKIKDTDFAKENSEITNQLVKLSTDIHEIKKDYKRIFNGLEMIVPDLKTRDEMTMDEIFNIVIETNKRYEKLIQKNIIFEGKCHTQILVKNYLSVTSIINNLINNAVEAVEGDGKVFLSVFEKEDALVIEVIDNGMGISGEDIQYIFLPGYSTKYDKKTGKMSTGVGLSQVRNLVEKRFNGIIEVHNRRKKGTRFSVTLPIEYL